MLKKLSLIWPSTSQSVTFLTKQTPKLGYNLHERGNAFGAIFQKHNFSYSLPRKKRTGGGCPHGVNRDGAEIPFNNELDAIFDVSHKKPCNRLFILSQSTPCKFETSLHLVLRRSKGHRWGIVGCVEREISPKPIKSYGLLSTKCFGIFWSSGGVKLATSAQEDKKHIKNRLATLGTKVYVNFFPP